MTEEKNTYYVTFDWPPVKGVVSTCWDMTTEEGILGHQRDLVLYGQALGKYPPIDPTPKDNQHEP